MTGAEWYIFFRTLLDLAKRYEKEVDANIYVAKFIHWVLEETAKEVK